MVTKWMNVRATEPQEAINAVKALHEFRGFRLEKLERQRNDRKIDLRVSIVPAFYGEAVGMRILDPTEAKISMDKIGCEQNEIQIITKASSSPQGMLLVTGPTGSGKTSTLYAALNAIIG